MDKATAQKHLDEWLEADVALAASQSYSIGGRALTRADADQVAARINYWNRQVQAFATREQGGTPGIVTPKFR